MKKAKAQSKDAERAENLDLIATLGTARVLRLAGMVRGKLQTPHAGPGAPRKPTACPKCGVKQPSAAAAKAHCA